VSEKCVITPIPDASAMSQMANAHLALTPDKPSALRKAGPTGMVVPE